MTASLMKNSRFAALIILTATIPLIALGVSEPSDIEQRCVVRELAQRELTTESGRKIFVEPVSFVSDANGDIFLVGPSDISTVDSSGSTTDVARNAIFGVVVDSHLNHYQVPNPIAPEVIGVRAAATASSGWHVVFGQTASSQQSAPSSPGWVGGADFLWYGVFSGRTWTMLERLPTPPGATVYQLFASRLATNGDSLAMAVPMRNSRGEPHILLYERRKGVWSYEIIPTVNSRAETAYSAHFGLVLAVVQPDSTDRQGDGGSLIIRTRAEKWQPMWRLVHGRLEGEVLNPSVSFIDDTLIVGYYASSPGARAFRGLQAREIVGALQTREARTIVLDSSVLGESEPLIPVIHDHRVRVWITRHHSPASAYSELRFLQETADVVNLLRSMPDPFTAYVSAVSIDSSRLVVSGLKYVPGKYVASLLLQFRVNCSLRPN
jgi:hypothetical protein